MMCVIFIFLSKDSAMLIIHFDGDIILFGFFLLFLVIFSHQLVGFHYWFHYFYFGHLDYHTFIFRILLLDVFDHHTFVSSLIFGLYHFFRWVRLQCLLKWIFLYNPTFVVNDESAGGFFYPVKHKCLLYKELKKERNGKTNQKL